MVRPISFGTVTRDALPDQIAQRLIALITEKHLKPGDRLPPERELSATMGVSRSSLREALRALAMLGVAEMRQGDGTYLTALDPETLMRPVGLVLASQRRRPGRALRGAQAGRARPRLPRRRAHRRRRRPRNSPVRAGVGRRARRPRRVHVARHRAARADRPRRRQRDPVAAAGIGRVDGDRQPPGTGRQAQVREHSVRDHLEIAAAIAAHAPEEARDAMLRHLENVERAVNG